MRFSFCKKHEAMHTVSKKLLNKTFLKNYFELYLYDEPRLTCNYLLTYNMTSLYRLHFSSS